MIGRKALAGAALAALALGLMGCGADCQPGYQLTVAGTYWIPRIYHPGYNELFWEQNHEVEEWLSGYWTGGYTGYIWSCTKVPVHVNPVLPRPGDREPLPEPREPLPEPHVR